VRGRGTTATLASGYNELLDRLDAERRERTLGMLAGQEAERQRIGQELHDEVGQSLTALLLGMRRLAPHVDPAGAQDLSFLQDLTRASLDEVRRITRALRPSALDDLGLHGSLGALVADFTATTGFPVTRSFSPAVTDDVPHDLEVVLYRIAQEALTNVARHARATAVRLSLTRVGDSIVLVVSDDGVGVAEGCEGSGIQGMRERALLVGGELTVSRPANGGTEVRLVAPRTGRRQDGG
jgi:two-component system sensor histidine kinase UhpB